MAFPVVAGEANGIGSGTSHTVNLPASIAAGDLLIAYFSCDGDPTITWPGGWTLRGALDAGGTGNSGQVRYRIADGTEGASITVTTSVSEFSVHQTYRITDWHGTTPPEFASGSWAATANPNPPSLAPSWGAEDTLWLASVLVNTGSTDITAFPTNYTNGVNRLGGGGFDDTSIGVARRELNAASEDPGTFTLASQQFSAAHTIAVRPAAAGGGQTIPVGQTLETDLSQPVAWSPKHRLVGQTVETDLAQALTIAKLVAVGQASEISLAQAIGRLKAKAFGQASETDLAQAITVGQAIIVTVGQALEADSAQAIEAIGGLQPRGSRSARAILLAVG